MISTASRLCVFAVHSSIPSILKNILLAIALAISSAVAAPNADSYPTPPSKKGLQVQMVDDALALGIKHAGLNCHLASFVDLKAQPDSLKWSLDGQDYFFKKRRVEALDASVKPLSDAGVLVSLILLNYENRNEPLDAIFMHPKYDPAAKTNHMGAFNTVTPDGVSHLRAVVAFLADRYSAAGSPNGRVWNYIVGNEVNSHWWWNNQGRATTEEIASDYERAVRLVHDAVRLSSVNARVFLSFEHHWGIRYPAGQADQSSPGRDLLAAFAKFARERGDFGWNLAFHPYPENLGDPRFWRDKSATQADDSPRITFKNLEILTRHLQKPELLFAGKPRRVILSEQGFHCREDATGESDQAAAYCAAYWKVAHLDGIDSFILHRHVDHAHEGLNLGLWTHKPDTIATPDRHRQMYDLFKVADTAEWEPAFRFALPIIGIGKWEDLLPK